MNPHSLFPCQTEQRADVFGIVRPRYEPRLATSPAGVFKREIASNPLIEGGNNVIRAHTDVARSCDRPERHVYRSHRPDRVRMQGHAGEGADRYRGVRGAYRVATRQHDQGLYARQRLRPKSMVAGFLFGTLGGVPLSTSLAAIILGSGSACLETRQYLVEPLPVICTPAGVKTRCQPIRVIDALGYPVGGA